MWAPRGLPLMAYGVSYFFLNLGHEKTRLGRGGSVNTLLLFE